MGSCDGTSACFRGDFEISDVLSSESLLIEVITRAKKMRTTQAFRLLRCGMFVFL